MSLLDINTVSDWNNTLRAATASGQTVVVDFHATWCGPCKTIAPIYKTLSTQNAQVKFLRVDVDKVQPIAAKYKISAMPTFLAIKAGQVVDTLKGADPQGLTRLVLTHAGPNPPVAPLPADAEAKRVEGNAHFKEGKFSEAAEQYTEAIKLAPTAFSLYGNRSLSYLKSTPPNAEAALADAEKAVEIEPAWGKGWVRVGESLLVLEKTEDAVKAFEKAVENSDGLVQKEAKQKLQAAKQKLGWH